jgi:hypothetical protein
MDTHEDELEFFNDLSGKLEIELSEPPQQVSPNLLNLQASPDAKVVSLKLKAHVFDRKTDESRELTPEEWNSVAFRSGTIKLRSDEGRIIQHKAPNGKFFTVRDLVTAVEQTERETRGETDWLGGVDVHHVYFEGIHQEEEGVWDIYWGS